MSDRNHRSSDDIIKMAGLLARIERIAAFDDEEEEEAWRLAHALCDIRDSCEKIAQNLFPAIMSSGLSEDDLEEALLSIGEELRHILYHVKACRFYGYVQ